MTPLSSRRRPGADARSRFAAIALSFAALAAAAGWLPAARAQVAAPPEDLGAVERMTLVRTGTFEIWQDTTRLGTEFYRVYESPRRDSLLAASTVRYELRADGGLTTIEKWTLSISRRLDAFPLRYQRHEQTGGRQRSLSLLTRDTTATVYREVEGFGEGTVVRLPPGRIYILDPGIYEHVENLVSDFFLRGLETREQNVLMTPSDEVQQVRLTRGPREKVEVPGRGTVEATRVDLFDDLTLIRVWLDDEGRMLRLEAPAQRIRVVRLPPGDQEAAAGAQAKRPAPERP